MNLNLTLIGQSLAFLFFVWFCGTVIWPRFMAILEQRRRTIVEGLEAAKKGQLEFRDAQMNAERVILDAKKKSEEMIELAHTSANRIEEQSKIKASKESKRIIAAANQEAMHLEKQLKEELRNEVGDLAILIAEKIMQEKIDQKLHDKLINDLAKHL